MNNETENKLEENSFPEKLTFTEFVKFILSKQQLNTAVFPVGWKTRPVYPLAIMYIAIYPLFGVIWGCSPEPQPEEKAAVQQQSNNDAQIPPIKIMNNKLIVDGNEMLAKDFVEKYCFAHKDNQTCIEALNLKLIQHSLQGGKMPKNW